MDMIIHQLDNSTINKIAAGEVVENPRSIVKELVENSIDAKADEIIIEIKNGGKKLIRITDNGSGIKKDDIENAFKRHFTSKIDNAEDLNSLHTLGFRGEALASIAEVSRVEMVTRTVEENHGIKIVIEGGEIKSKDEIGCPVGTTIIVSDLFYNVPARKKFLKSDSAESSNINEIVTCLSLCSLGISFKYINNNNVIFKTPKTDKLLNVISSLYEKELTNSLLEVDYKNDFMSISGYTSNLNYYRGNRKNQLLFVNNRFVKHKRINYFIEAAYNTMLPKDKRPVCFLKININPSLIDVNVHPAKTEIRFENEDIILNELKNAIWNALNQRSLVKEVVVKEKQQDTKKESIFVNEYNLNLDDDIVYKEINIDKPLKIVNYTSESDRDNILVKEDNLLDIDESDFVMKTETALNTNNCIDDEQQSIDIIDLSQGIPEQTLTKAHDDKPINLLKQLKVIGVLLETYILCENSLQKELYIIDQHAAHERINYERLMKQVKNKSVIQQELLVPEVINLSHEDYYTTISNKDIFEMIGLSIENFGINDILINSIPIAFVNLNVKTLFFNILDSIKDDKKLKDIEYRIEKVIKNACVQSVKAGDTLHSIEIQSLLNELSETDNPYTCPHGRPVIVKMTNYEIERMFERIQI